MGSIAIVGTIWSLVFLEYIWQAAMVVEPSEGGGPDDLAAFHRQLTSRYATKTKRTPDFQSGRVEYVFSGGDKQFYYHLSKGITEAAGGPKVTFSIR